MDPPSRPEGARSSAVLVAVAASGAGPEIVLIERAAGLRAHPGQPALPGGSAEHADRGPAGTALREAYEEIGLDPAEVQVLGVLPARYIGVSGFLVTPVLGWWRAPHRLDVVDTDEIARVVTVPVAELAAPGNRCRVRLSSGSTGPAFTVGGMVVWGFTASVLDVVLELAGWVRPSGSGASGELLPTAETS